MHDRPTPRTAIDLLCRTERKTDSIIPEEGSLSTTVAAQVKVDVGTVLVGSSQTTLGA